jgi:hypothetical protein
MINRRYFIGSLAAATFVAGPVAARPSDIFAKSGYAIRGIDPVAYFRKAMPVDGVNAYRLRWHSAIWRFENAANMYAFEGNPHAFAPRYGGYCAMSLTAGLLSESTPEAWAIHDRKLYLIHSVAERDLWLRDPDHYIAQANAHWPQMF